MARRVRTYETDHPYALQSWEGRYPHLIPGDGTNDVLRVRAPRSYWLSLDANYPDYQNKDGFAPIDVLRRDLNATNGCPLLGDSFKTRVKKTISELRKTFLKTDWQNKAEFKTELMWISIKAHDFLTAGPKESPTSLTPPPRFGPRPKPAAMFHHFPKYDEPASDHRRPADELQWDALFGIPQIGCESIITASHSSEEVSSTVAEDVYAYGPADYGDITTGIVI